MSSGLRKLALAAHITLSVGWLGAVVAYLALAIIGLVSSDTPLVRVVYPSMDLLARLVIVPMGLIALLVGFVESLGTSWGLIRHWWVLLKFLLTTAGVLVLLKHTEAISRMAMLADQINRTALDYRDLRIQLVVHAAGGLAVLFAATLLSIYKPWGLTPYGQRLQQGQSVSSRASVSRPGSERPGPVARPTPRWVYIVGFHAVGLAILVLIVHLTGAVPHGQ
jgi:hypothetical protein